MKQRILSIISLAIIISLLSAGGLGVTPAKAASPLTITPNAWNVIGLDSNTPATGPYRFPIGARLYNTSGVPVTTTVTFYWDNGGAGKFWGDPGANAYINLRTGSKDVLTITVPANGYSDAFFEVEVLRDASAFEKTREYHITAVDSGGSVSTPLGRELYVEHLISQNRNGVREVWLNSTLIPAYGTMYLQVGQTYEITLKGFTATNGYNQFEDFINLPNTVFQVNSVSTDYAVTSSPIVTPRLDWPMLYADACGWDNDPDSPTYRSCIVDSLAKTGGDPVETTYNVTILSVTGPESAGTLTTLLYDFSGSSYHYNSDFGITYNYQVVDPTQATIGKLFNPRSSSTGFSGFTSQMTITLNNPTGATITGVTFTDIFPTTPGSITVAGTPGVTNSCNGNVYNSNSGTNPVVAGDPGIKLVGGSIAANSSCTITVNVQISANGNYTNTTGNLFVDVNGISTDTGKFGRDTLNVGTTPAPPPSCGGLYPAAITLASWNFDTRALGSNAGPIPADSQVSDLLTARANYGAGANTYNLSGIADLTNNFFLKDAGGGVIQYLHPGTGLTGRTWGIEAGDLNNSGGWTTGATVPSGAAPYFEFEVAAGNYGGLQIAAVANLQGSWANSGSWYVFSSTDHTTWTQVGTAGWTNAGWKGNNWGTIPASAIAGVVNASTTYFRIVFNGASSNKTDPTVFIDGVTITGCKYPPEPSFTKSFSPKPIAVGSTSTLTFTINNSASGSQTLNNVSFTDTLPLGLTVATGSASLSGVGCTGSATLTSPRTISLSGAQVNAGSICTIPVTVTGAVKGAYVNVTSYLSSTETGETKKYAEDTINVIAPPVISKTFSPSSVLLNGTSTLTFTITNPNSIAAGSLTGISFVDDGTSGSVWPAGLTVVSPGGPTAACNGSYTTTANSLTFTGGSLAPNASCSFSITVQGTTVGAKTNTTSAVTATGPVSLTGNQASATLTVNTPVPLLGLNKEVSIDGVNWFKYVGLEIPGSVYYRFTISNEGETALTGISVSDPNVTVCALPATLAVGASASCSTSAISITGAPTPNPFENTATATSNEAPPVTSKARYGTEHITIVKYVTESYFTASGQTLNYRYTVTNDGGYPLLGPITVSDDKVGTVSCQAVTAVGDLDSFFDPGEVVFCPGPTAADFTTYLTTGTDVDNKQVVNTAYGIANKIEGGTINSTPDTKTVPLAPDLTVAKTNDALGSVVLGNTYQWTLTVTNAASAGPASFLAGATLLTDNLPNSNVAYSAVPATATNAGGTTGTISCSVDGSYNLTCTAGTAVTMPAGGSFSITFTVTPTAVGSLVNPRGAGVCTVNPGPSPITEILTNNNDCSDTVTVTKATPNVTTVIHDESEVTVTEVVVNSTVHDRADVTGLSSPYPAPTGNVSFTFYTNNTCTGLGTAAGTVALDGSGVAHPSSSQGPLVGGYYSFKASYAGDSNYFAADGACEPLFVIAPGLTLVKTGAWVDGDADGIAEAGETINYTFTVTNTGNVTLYNVTVTDTNPLVTVLGGPTTLDVGEVDTTTFTGSYVLIQADIDAGSFYNLAWATGDCSPLGGLCVTSPPDDHLEPLPPAPALTHAKTGTLNVGGNGRADAGDTITYAFTVTNTGNVTLTNVTITDLLVTVLGGPITLQPGQTDNTTFTGTYVLTQADVDAGTFTNTATAHGNCPTGLNPCVNTPDDDTQTLPSAPAIDLVKTGTLNDAVVAPAGVVNVGDQITYGFTVTNTGNVTLTNVTVTDLGLTVLGGPITLLPGASDSTTFTATYTLTQTDINAGVKVNDADAEGTPPSGPRVTKRFRFVAPLAQSPSISLDKTGTLDLTVVPPAGAANVGDTITYVFTVTNTGNVTLTNVKVTDPTLPGLNCEIASLLPGASQACVATGNVYSLILDDLIAGTHSNTALVTGTPPSGPDVTATDNDTQTLPAAGSILVTKTASPTTLPEPGGAVTFTVRVDNTSSALSVTISSLTDSIHGNLNGQGNCAVSQTILAGGFYECAFSASVTGNAGYSETDVATASGTDGNSNPVTGNDNATVTLTNVPSSILVTKTASPITLPEPGGAVTFTVRVDNTSTVDSVTISSLTDSIHGNLNGQGTCVVPQTIPAGGFYQCSFTASVTGNAGYSETDVATASGTDDDRNVVTGSDDATVTVTTAFIDMSVVKVDSADPVNVNAGYTYTLSVNNAGPAAATNVVVTDTLPANVAYVNATGTGWACVYAAGPHTVTCTRAALAVGPAPDITISVTAPPVPGTVTNTITVSSDQTETDGTNNNDSEDTLVVQSDPNVIVKTLIDHNQPSTVLPQVAIGEILTYRVVVTIPPGTFMTARLVDTLGQGLAFVDCSSITASSGNLTTDVVGGFAALCGNTVPTLYSVAEYLPGSVDLADQGRQVTYPFGTLVNTNTANETLTVEYRAVVLNNSGNQDGTSLSNTAIFSWDETKSLPPASAGILTVVEPDLTLSKTVNATIAVVGAEVTFTLTIDHSGLSHQNAYDAVLSDPLPAELDFVVGSLDCTLGAQDPNLGCAYDAPTRTITAGWSNFSQAGGNSVIRFRATINTIPAAGVTNTANLAWTSLPGTPPACPTCLPGVQSPYNSLSTERFFDPGSPVNIYGTNATLVLGVLAEQALPATGFAPGVVTDMNNVEYVAYQQSAGLELEIPSLGVRVPIVGVPLRNGAWNVSWLGNQAGWLNGTAYPTWDGNSVLTAHVYQPSGLPGPFINLGNLRWGDRLIVHLDGQSYIYGVRSAKSVRPDDLTALKHEDLPWLTLITCKQYDETAGKYLRRTVVRAVLIDVRADSGANGD